MLERLYIKNVALITEADIAFGSGLNVLSGETGSGKSVILDSVNFVLGSKADRSMIRYGEQEAFVRAEFSLPSDSAALAVLDEYDIESDGELIITRRLGADGRGGIKVNGNAVTAAMLKKLTQRLVDVHGQSEHFFLLSEENQLKAIDDLLGESAEQIKSSLRECLNSKMKLLGDIAALGGSDEERARRLDLLEYQLGEIENADVHSGEYGQLKERQILIRNAEKIVLSLGSAKSALDDDGGCTDSLSVALKNVNQLAAFGEEYAQLAARLEELFSGAQDVVETISDISDKLAFDDGEAVRVEERISLLHALKKKYGATEEDILAYADGVRAEIERLSDSAVLTAKYLRQVKECEERIYGLCRSLTEARRSAAEKFSESVVCELKTLNIPDAAFRVDFNEYDRDSIACGANGADKICFSFSANKGEPAKPLSKVISGGEMSRFMLAVKTCVKNVNGISTYIFDEIDSGISGYTAGTVAGKLRAIGRHTQIIAVSHLPQVCAASDRQFLIYKVNEGDKTYTKVKPLDEREKLAEIVRLTGNVVSESAARHAEELIAKYRN